MYETDSTHLEEKNPVAGCGVAQDSEGPTARQTMEEPRKASQHETHQTGQKTQDP